MPASFGDGAGVAPRVAHEPAVDAADNLVSDLGHAWRHHVDPDPAPLGRLLQRHREDHRRYHTVVHVASVVTTVGELAQREEVADLGAVIAAAFYHDAIYDPASSANEQASAQLAFDELRQLGWSDDRAQYVDALIEATSHHRDPPDTGHAVLFDADLSILGAERDAYARYTDGVRNEYHHVDDESWTRGRRTVLGDFLARPSIYATVTGRTRWEATARANIASELSSLVARP